MGTSTNQRSPSNDPSWKIFQRTLGSGEFPIERQVAELWKAAGADEDGRFVTELSSASIAQALRLASTSRDAVHAARQFADVLNQSQASGVVFDLARRALLRSVANEHGASGFAEQLFVEAADYYVSRDIPSYVAARGRIATTGESLALKDQVRNLTRQTVAPIAKEVANRVRVEGRIDLKVWRNFVRSTLSALKKRGQK